MDFVRVLKDVVGAMETADLRYALIDGFAMSPAADPLDRRTPRQTLAQRVSRDERAALYSTRRTGDGT